MNRVLTPLLAVNSAHDFFIVIGRFPKLICNFGNCNRSTSRIHRQRSIKAATGGENGLRIYIPT